MRLPTKEEVYEYNKEWLSIGNDTKKWMAINYNSVNITFTDGTKTKVLNCNNDTKDTSCIFKFIGTEDIEPIRWMVIERNASKYQKAINSLKYYESSRPILKYEYKK
jgi:hypothetical protein